MKRLNFIITLLALLVFAVITWAGTVSERPYGISTPKWYGYSAGEKSDYYVEHPTLTGNDQVVTEDATQTLTNKAIDGDDNTLSDIAYSSIKSTSRSGSDATVITGTAGTDTYTAKWNADGDLVDGYAVIDDDSMATAASDNLPSAESVKAYADAQKRYITGEIADISTSASSWAVSPIAGTITQIYTVIDGTIATADAGISFELGGTAITDGGVTIAYDGSAAGDVDSATPSAANTVTAGGAIELITDGASTNAVKAVVVFEITP